jgi:hypothetical protein
MPGKHIIEERRVFTIFVIFVRTQSSAHDVDKGSNPVRTNHGIMELHIQFFFLVVCLLITSSSVDSPPM